MAVQAHYPPPLWKKTHRALGSHLSSTRPSFGGVCREVPWRASAAIITGCHAIERWKVSWRGRQHLRARKSVGRASNSHTVPDDPTVYMEDTAAQKAVACHYVSGKLRLLEKPGGEIGVVAAAPIPPGELLIAESQVGDFSFVAAGSSEASTQPSVQRRMPVCLAPRTPSQLPDRYLGVLPLRALPASFWQTRLGGWLMDYMRFSTNAFSSGLIVVGSFVNHSCTPNSRHASRKIVREDRSFSVDIHYADRPIAPGEEVLTCYAEELLELPCSLRRPLLQVGMGFWCDCPRCKSAEAGLLEPPVESWNVLPSEVDVLLDRAVMMAPAAPPAMHACGPYAALTAALLVVAPLLPLASAALGIYLFRHT
mmetsp:Transcript_36331/g.73216  ORF Transcript_36331/g.73216 Transcript_36331/m.73216 type:complete len:367 (+) Transcript_36331:81-1181(+)